MTALKDTALWTPAIELFRTRGQLRHVETLDKNVQGWIRAYGLAGPLATLIDGVPQIDRQTVHREASAKVDSKKIKKLYPSIYARSRVFVPWHAITHKTDVPTAGDYGFIVFPDAPEVSAGGPGMWNLIKGMEDAPSLEAVIEEKRRLRPVVGALKKSEDDAKLALELAGEQYLRQGWDGAPWDFDDGYTYGMRAQRFNADVAMELLTQEQYAAVVMVTPASESTRYVLLEDPEHTMRQRQKEGD